MTVHALKERLNELAWTEQVNFELSERHPGASSSSEKEFGQRIRELGQRLSPAMLDALERQEGYLTWVLRLSPYVPGDDADKRAKRHAEHRDSQVRFWANQILDH